MAANYDPDWVVRLSLFFQQGTQGGQIDRNLTGGILSVGAFYTSTDLFTQLAAAGVYTAARACVSPTTTFLGAKLYYKPLALPPIIAEDTSGAGVGTASAGDLPSQVSGLISWQSSVGGAKGRGRDYMPFPNTAASTSAGVPSAGYLTELTNFADTIINGWNVPNGGPGPSPIRVRPCIKYTPPGASTPPPMTSYTIAVGFATQKRRGYFGKPNRSPFA